MKCSERSRTIEARPKERRRALATRIQIAVGSALGCVVLLASCGGEPLAQESDRGSAADSSLATVCEELHRSAATGDGPGFSASAMQFAGTERYLDELLTGFETGQLLDGDLDQLTGALDFALRLLSEHSTALSPHLAEHSDAYVDRMIGSLLMLPPEYGEIMLTRWGSWGHVKDRHAPTLVSACAIPRMRATALENLAHLDLTGALQAEDYVLLEQLANDRTLTSTERQNLVIVLLGRGNSTDVALFMEIVDAWHSDSNPWGLIGLMMKNVKHSDTVRSLTRALASWPYCWRWDALAGFRCESSHVTELAAAEYFGNESVSEAAVCLVLGGRNRDLLEAVVQSADSLDHRVLALQGLIAHHLSLLDGVQRAQEFYQHHEGAMRNSSRLRTGFLRVLITLVNVASHQSASLAEENLEQLLATSREVFPSPEFDVAFTDFERVLQQEDTP